MTKKFNLEAAMNGAKVMTSGGLDARIVCFDHLGKYPIVALVDKGEKEAIFLYCNEGKFRRFANEYDLVMAAKPNGDYIYPKNRKA